VTARGYRTVWPAAAVIIFRPKVSQANKRLETANLGALSVAERLSPDERLRLTAIGAAG